MKFAIVADDLTGANDSGAQLARAGLSTTVVIDHTRMLSMDGDAVVFDTDSRAASRTEAYRRVRAVCESIKQSGGRDVYKKIDSMMRGNIGAEIDAVYDVFAPDFVVIAPAFPKNGRQVIEGRHYVNGTPLHQSEAASDPKTPVTESYLPKLLAQQTDRPIALVTYRELRSGPAYMQGKLDQLKAERIPYVIFDTEEEADLQAIAIAVTASGHRVVWAGSAGLVAHLPLQASAERTERVLPDEASPSPAQPVLLVVGSASPASRRQVERLLEQPGVAGVTVHCERIVSHAEDCRQELERVRTLASEGLAAGASVALHCASGPEDVAAAQRIGASRGMSAAEVGGRIAEAMGQLAGRLLGAHSVAGIVLTGGDIAKQTIAQLGAGELRLLGEVETGVPVGRLIGAGELRAVTKAGSFGSEHVLWKAIQLLQAREDK